MTASVTENGIATVVPSVGEGDPVRVVVKAENGDILGEYRLHFTNDKDLLASKPVVAVKSSRLVAKVILLSYLRKSLFTSQAKMAMKSKTWQLNGMKFQLKI